MTTGRLEPLAGALAGAIRKRSLKIVFAESCTGGLAAATVTAVPGASDWFCGSAVAYRLDTKTRWLGVPAALLADPGPVSREVAEAMAAGALEATPEADLAVAVTGHLGPDAPAGQDGLAYVCVTPRGEGVSLVVEHWLDDGPAAAHEAGMSLRVRRQRAAAQQVFEAALQALK